jgi:predicted N-acyltransferase
MPLDLERTATLQNLEAARWNALAGDSPFLRHEFLTALERSGCIGRRTAWQPVYLLAKSAGELVGALPLYLKYDSRGEFVFDWGWADAYERSGRRYYPKLVSSIPFTPATGTRLLVRPGADAAAVRECLVRGARAVAMELNASSLHVLFPTEAERAMLDRQGFLSRKSCQFHWHNDGYADFDEFLSRFSSAKRKKAKRERRRVAEAEITFAQLRGNEPTDSEWNAVFEFYASTFERRGRPPYLNRAFFAEVARTMPENILIVLARYQGAPIAAAICFRGGTTLYGRYWGSAADFHSLHFETCYYQGIEFCIARGIATFEGGSRGEHKLARGLLPVETCSAHWLAHPEFAAAVDQFLARETRGMKQYVDELADHSPFK